MPRLVALEWDAKEARVVVARSRGKGVVVEQAFAVVLPQKDAGAAAEADVGAAIAKALAEHGLAKSDALVAVGRSNIELKFLSTPPVPPEELPDIVRFQALRQFTSLGDDWPLDYVPLAANADGGSNVLAAAISPELVKQIRETCAAAGVAFSRLVLRPFAAASLLKDRTTDGKCRMLVDLLRDDADLTVLIGDQVIFPRTVRLPTLTEPEALARSVLGEGRRTIIAAQNQLGGRRVEEVVIFGDGQHHTVLKQLLEKELSLPVELVDPFTMVEWADEARTRKPEYPGTFAPLLGMLLDEAAERRPIIDFLHPRKKAEPPNRRRTYIMAGVGVGALALAGLVMLQMQLWSLDGRIKQLSAEVVRQEKLAKTTAKPIADAAKLDHFAASDITWLDELRILSERFPPAEAARVEDIYASAVTKGGGKATINGAADQPATIGEIERTLRDGRHTVLGSGGKYDAQGGDLKWKFREEVIIAPITDDMASAAKAAKGAPPAPKKAASGKPATGGRP